MYGYITFCFSIHQVIDIWVVSTFYLLWTLPLWTVMYKFLCGHVCSFLLGYIPGSWMAGACANYVEPFEELPACFPKWLHHLTLPPTMHVCSNFTNSVTKIIIWLYYSHLHVCEWHLILVLICTSLITHDVKRLIYCAYWLFAFLLWRNIYSNPLPNFWLGYLSLYYWLVRVPYIFLVLYFISCSGLLLCFLRVYWAAWKHK